MTESGRGQCQGGGSSSAVLPGIQSFPNRLLCHIGDVIPRPSLGLQELWLHPTEEVFPLHIFLFERGNLSFLEAPSHPCGSLVRARAHAPQTLITTKETGVTMTGLHLSRPIPRPQGPGAMDLNTSAGEKKETVSNSKAFHRIPVPDCWCPRETGCGLPEGRNSVSPSVRNTWTSVLVPD